MKTNFPIYWIDDNAGFYDSIRDEVETHVRDEHGLHLQVAFREKPVGAIEEIASMNPYLVVVDHRLGGGTTGDIFIKELRKRNLFHEVLFYTMDGFSASVLQSFFSDPSSGLAMGVHFAAKGNAKGRLCNIIDLRLSQVFDLATQRGWIVADAIDLEFSVDEFLVKASSVLHAVFSETVLRVLDERSRVDFGFKVTLANGLLKDVIAYLRSNHGGATLISSLEGKKAILSGFTADIIEIRNQFAHQKASSGGTGGLVLKGLNKKSPDLDFSRSVLRKTRLNISKHRRNMDELMSSFDEVAAAIGGHR